jgi:phenylacetic acid degradation operon negative regulatory protein
VRDEPRALAVRRALRSAAIALRLAELREGTWIRPANLDPERLPEQRSTLAAQCTRFTGGIAVDEPPARIFDIDAWSDKAIQLLDRLSASFPPSLPVAPADQLTVDFELSITVVRHLQTDPLLPDELLPGTWPGPRLRAAYLTHDERLKQTWANSIPHSEFRS